MGRLVDLHIHSNQSDGSFEPQEIVEIAKKNNLKVIALTDHDTIDGLYMLPKSDDTQIIKGIEISCNENDLEVHILGYFLDIYDKKFIKDIDKIKNARNIRNQKMINKFKNLGIILEPQKLKEYAGGDVVGRLHFANYLIDLGVVKDKNEAFSKYLGNDAPAYEPKENVSPKYAIEIIKKNGGIVSLAHPYLITKNLQKLEEIIKDYQSYGLDALEVNYTTFSKSESKYLKKLAKKYDLKITGGSDFHGTNRIGVDIGDSGIDLEEFEILKKLINQ